MSTQISKSERHFCPGFLGMKKGITISLCQGSWLAFDHLTIQFGITSVFLAHFGHANRCAEIDSRQYSQDRKLVIKNIKGDVDSEAS